VLLCKKEIFIAIRLFRVSKALNPSGLTLFIDVTYVVDYEYSSVLVYLISSIHIDNDFMDL
jgi:hypothetical protein